MRGKGKSSGRGSSRLPDPNPLKVAHMVSDAIEMAPRLAIPLEVVTGAHLPNLDSLPYGNPALIRVRNTEDGHEYHILVLPRPSKSTSTSSRSLITPPEGSNGSNARESGSSSSS